MALLNDLCHLQVDALERLFFLGLGRWILRDSRDARKDTALAVNLASILQLSAQEAGDSIGVSEVFLIRGANKRKSDADSTCAETGAVPYCMHTTGFLWPH